MAVLRQFGLKEVATVRSGRSGKQYAEKQQADVYHEEIMAKLATVMSPGMPLVLLGPGFEKESLAEDLKKAGHKVYVYHTGQSGMVGVNELLKTGMGADVLRESSVGVEMEAVEELMTAIAKDRPSTYGPGQVMAAALAGAVEKLLVLDSRLREQDLDEMVRAVEAQKGEVIVVSEQHDGGKQLAALGGVGALLRYRME